jgi:hypothetical protein
MEIAQIWESPYGFRRDDGSIVFSYGLLLPQAGLAYSPVGRERLAARWGREAVAALAVELEAKGQAALDDFHTRHAGVPLTEAAVSEDNVRSLGIIEFSAALHKAADAQETVPEGFEGSMQGFLNRVKRPDRFVWMRRRGSDALVRVPRYDSLLERLALEYDALASHRPRLSRCRLCGRVFVPQRPARPEAQCRANLWLATDPPQLVERCFPAVVTAERAKEKKRRDQAYRRLLKRHGDPDHPEVKAAKRSLDDWLVANRPIRRGRQSRPEPGDLELVPELVP